MFEREGCNACHGDNGTGTAAAPKLIGVGGKYDKPKLQTLLRSPTDKMTAGGMTAVELKEDEMKELVSYLDSLN